MFWLSKGNFNYQTVFHHTIRLYYYKSRINHKNHFESKQLAKKIIEYRKCV